jgi:hypothetical protein
MVSEIGHAVAQVTRHSPGFVYRHGLLLLSFQGYCRKIVRNRYRSSVRRFRVLFCSIV